MSIPKYPSARPACALPSTLLLAGRSPPERKRFLHTLRVLSPTPSGRVPVSSHPAGAQSHPLGAGPGFFTPCGCSVPPLRSGSRFMKLKDMKRLCKGGWQTAARRWCGSMPGPANKPFPDRIQVNLKKPRLQGIAECARRNPHPVEPSPGAKKSLKRTGAYAVIFLSLSRNDRNWSFRMDSGPACRGRTGICRSACGRRGP